jgi:hypothetical protein
MKLISLVQRHECLYNLQNKDYDNSLVKDKCWKEKAGELHCTVGEWHGMCKLAFNVAGKRHGMCESALSFPLFPCFKLSTVVHTFLKMKTSNQKHTLKNKSVCLIMQVSKKCTIFTKFS